MDRRHRYLYKDFTDFHSNRPFCSCVHICQAFDVKWSWRWPCRNRNQYLVSTVTKWFIFEKQQRLYHNKATLSLTPIQRLGNQAHHYDIDYRKKHKGTYDALKIINLKWITSKLIFNVWFIFIKTIHSVMSLTIINVYIWEKKPRIKQIGGNYLAKAHS